MMKESSYGDQESKWLKKAKKKKNCPGKKRLRKIKRLKKITTFNIFSTTGARYRLETSNHCVQYPETLLGWVSANTLTIFNIFWPAVCPWSNLEECLPQNVHLEKGYCLLEGYSQNHKYRISIRFTRTVYEREIVSLNNLYSYTNPRSHTIRKWKLFELRTATTSQNYSFFHGT